MDVYRFWLNEEDECGICFMSGSYLERLLMCQLGAMTDTDQPYRGREKMCLKFVCPSWDLEFLIKCELFFSF